MSPPSSGGTHIVQILNILEGFPMAEFGHNSADAIHHMAEAMKLAYADRSKYLGDTDYVEVPLAGLTSKGYADELRKGIDPDNELVLARYQRRRKGENLAMMAAMEGFKQLFGRDELTLRWLRNTGMRWLNQLGPIKNRIAAEAMGLDA